MGTLLSGLRALRPALLLAAFGVLPLLPAAAQDWPVPPNKGYASVKELLAARCSSCHGWAKSHDQTVIPGRVTPGSPEESRLFVKVATGAMPLLGRKLALEEVGLIRAWIEAGAPSTDTPLASPAPDATAGSTSAAAAPSPSPADTTAAASTDVEAGDDYGAEADASASASAASSPAPADATAAATGAAPSTSEAGPKKLSPFAVKLKYHEISGFASGGLLLASGIVGGVHFLNMREAAHDIRDQFHLEEESAACRAAMADAWRGDATLRWVHVGLLGAGELLYLTDAITGLTMLTPDKPGLTRQDIHRYAFFTHAALMAAEIVMGFITTDALKRGDHELVIGMGVAHTAVGFAIPAVILGAGVLASRR